ncbi:MAG TPA: hypothetical protein VEM39_02325 [Myxococcaceae bacterium]|nr:hypothetical protein [Myxococcaceae bacterium]
MTGALGSGAVAAGGEDGALGCAGRAPEGVAEVGCEVSAAAGPGATLD